jgi:hypothetical protein
MTVAIKHSIWTIAATVFGSILKHGATGIRHGATFLLWALVGFAVLGQDPDGGPMRATAQVIPCVGDCDGNLRVTVSELVTGVNIAGFRRPVDDCLAGDPNGDRNIRVNEIVAAVKIPRAIRHIVSSTISADSHLFTRVAIETMTAKNTIHAASPRATLTPHFSPRMVSSRSSN